MQSNQSENKIPYVVLAPKPSRSGYWAVIIILFILLGFSFLGNLVFFAGAVSFIRYPETAQTAVDEQPKFQETWIYGAGDVKVVKLNLTGIISRTTGSSGLLDREFDPVKLLLRQIRAARNDQKVQAIILDLNTPGGVITPTDEIYTELQNFRASSDDRKVIVLVRELAASGGYYVAMASDWIIAEPTALVGSIGVIMQTLNWKGLSEKIGVHDVTITAGNNKDLLNPFQAVKQEHLDIFQTLLNEMHARFLQIVQTRLKMDTETLAPLADGRVFSAENALSLGLIDEIGYWDDVLNKTYQILGIKQARVVRYEEERTFFHLLSRLSTSSPAIQLPNLLPDRETHLMYLWTP